MRIPLRVVASVVAIVWPSLALAHSVDESVSVQGAQAIPTNPRTGSISDTLYGDFQLSDAWSLHASLSVMHQNVSTEATLPEAATRGGNVVNVGLGTEWDPSPHWSLGLDLLVSPKSTSSSTTPLPSITSGTRRLAVLKATSSNASAILSGSWVSAPESSWSTEVDLSLGGSSFHTTQRLTSLWSRTAQSEWVPITRTQIQSFCGGETSTATVLCKQLSAASQGTPQAVGQAELALGVTETIHQTTDIGLSWTYFAYSRDPTQVGFYTFGMAGRGFAVGQGIPIAPMRWDLHPDVLHQFGPVVAELWLDWSQYLPGLGHGAGLGARVAWNVSDALALFAIGTGRADVAADGTTTHSGGATLGVRYFF